MNNQCPSKIITCFLFIALNLIFFNFAQAVQCVNKPGGQLKNLKGERCPEMKSLEITKLTIKEVKAWNSSYEHQKKMPQPQNLWEATSADEKFKSLAFEVLKASKINNEYIIEDYFQNKPEIKRAPYDNLEKEPAGYIAAHEKIILEFNNGQFFELGKYPVYNLSKPFDQLYIYVKSLKPSIY